MLSGSQLNDIELSTCGRAHACPNRHRLEASLVLEEHGGWCHAGSRLSSSPKDVLAEEQGTWKPLSLVVQRLESFLVSEI